MSVYNAKRLKQFKIGLRSIRKMSTKVTREITAATAILVLS